MKWENPRWQRLLVWTDFIKSPSLVANGIKRPTFKQAWTGKIKIKGAMRNED